MLTSAFFIGDKLPRGCRESQCSFCMAFQHSLCECWFHLTRFHSTPVHLMPHYALIIHVKSSCVLIQYSALTHLCVQLSLCQELFMHLNDILLYVFLKACPQLSGCLFIWREIAELEYWLTIVCRKCFPGKVYCGYGMLHCSR